MKNNINVLSSNLTSELKAVRAGGKTGDEARAKSERQSCRRQKRKVNPGGFMAAGSQSEHCAQKEYSLIKAILRLS